MFAFQKRLERLVLSAPDSSKPSAPEAKRKYPLVVRGIPKNRTCPEDLQQLADNILGRSFRFFPKCQRFVDRVFYCLHVDGDMAVLVFLSELMAELLFWACRDESTSPFFIAGRRFTLDRNYIPSEQFGNSESKSVAYLSGLPKKWEDPQRLQSHIDSILEGDFPSKVVASVEVRRGAAQIAFTSTAPIDRLFYWIEQDPRLVTDISRELVICCGLKLVPFSRAISSGGLSRPARNPPEVERPRDRAPEQAGLLREESESCATTEMERHDLRGTNASLEQPGEWRNQVPAAWEITNESSSPRASQDQVTLVVSLPRGEIRALMSRLRQVIVKGLEKAGLDESGIAAIEVTCRKLWKVVFRSEAAMEALMDAYVRHTPDFCLADLPLAIYRHKNYARPGAVYRDGSAIATPQRVTLSGILPTLDRAALGGAMVELIERALAREGVLDPHKKPFQHLYWKKGSSVARLIMDDIVAEKLVTARGLTLAGYIVSFYS